MASKYRLYLSRCSLTACNLTTFPFRPSSQLHGRQGLLCCYSRKIEETVLRKDHNAFGYYQRHACYSTLAACRKRHWALHGDSSHLKFEKQMMMMKSKELLSVLKFRDMIGGIQTRGKGHSHWQNIKATKGAKDAQKAAVAGRVAKFIAVAVKEGGGGDPKLNKQLAKVMEEGLSAGVTKARIQDMVANALAKNKSMENGLLFALGPMGCTFIMEVYTDNMMRTRQVIGAQLKRAGGSLHNETGRQMFDEKGIITVSVTAAMEPVNMDKYLEVAIEAGAEDVIVTEDENTDGEKIKVLKFHCDPFQVNAVKKEIESHDLEVSSAETEFLPLSWVTLQGKELSVAQHIYERLSEQEDVVRIFDNVNTPEE